MATLDVIWATGREDMTRVASRKGSSAYVPLGVKTPEDLDLLEEDRLATDWEVCDIVAHDCYVLEHEVCPLHGAGQVIRG